MKTPDFREGNSREEEQLNNREFLVQNPAIIEIGNKIISSFRSCLRTKPQGLWTHSECCSIQGQWGWPAKYLLQAYEKINTEIEKKSSESLTVIWRPIASKHVISGLTSLSRFKASLGELHLVEWVDVGWDVYMQ